MRGDRLSHQAFVFAALLSDDPRAIELLVNNGCDIDMVLEDTSRIVIGGGSKQGKKQGKKGGKVAMGIASRGTERTSQRSVLEDMILTGLGSGRDGVLHVALEAADSKNTLDLNSKAFSKGEFGGYGSLIVLALTYAIHPKDTLRLLIEYGYRCGGVLGLMSLMVNDRPAVALLLEDKAALLKEVCASRPSEERGTGDRDQGNDHKVVFTMCMQSPFPSDKSDRDERFDNEKAKHGVVLADNLNDLLPPKELKELWETTIGYITQSIFQSCETPYKYRSMLDSDDNTLETMDSEKLCVRTRQLAAERSDQTRYMGHLIKKALEDGYWPANHMDCNTTLCAICGTGDADLANVFVRAYKETLRGGGETLVAAESLKNFVCITASEVPITLLKKLLSGVFVNGMKYTWLVETIANISVVAKGPELLAFLVEHFNLKDQILQESRDEILPSRSLMDAEEDEVDQPSSVLALILSFAWEEASDDKHLKPLGKKATESVVMALRVLYDLDVDFFSGQDQAAATRTILQCADLGDVPVLTHLLQLAAPLHPGIRFKQGEPRFELSGGVHS
jgi:hypothetical protein